MTKNDYQLRLEFDINFDCNHLDFGFDINAKHSDILQTITKYLDENPDWWKYIKFAFNYCHEEFNEFMRAMLGHNFKEIIDACADELVVFYGLLTCIGYPLHNLEKEYNYENTSIDLDIFTFSLNKDSRLNKVNNYIQKMSVIMNKLELEIENKRIEIVPKLTETMLKTIYEFCQFMGIDLYKAYRIIHSSNMSKLCHSEQEAIETVNYYKSDPNLSKEYKSPCYKKGKMEGVYVVYNKDTDKKLKSKYYEQPNLNFKIS